MEEAAGQYLDHNDGATDLSIPASVISNPQSVTNPQIANESQEEATTPESEIVYPPVVTTSQALSHLDGLITS